MPLPVIEALKSGQLTGKDAPNYVPPQIVVSGVTGSSTAPAPAPGSALEQRFANANAPTESDIINKQQADLSNKIGNLNKQSDTLNQELNSLNQESDTLKQENDSLNRDIDTFNTNPNTTKDEENALRKRQEDINSRYNSLAQRNTDYNNRVNKYQQEISSLPHTIPLTEQQVRDNSLLTQSAKDILLKGIKEGKVIPAESMPQPAGLAQSLWWGITPWAEENKETADTYRAEKGAFSAIGGVALSAGKTIAPAVGLAALNLIPAVGTVAFIGASAALGSYMAVETAQNWNQMSNAEKGFNSATVAMCFAPLALKGISEIKIRVASDSATNLLKSAKEVDIAQRNMRIAISDLKRTPVDSLAYKDFASVAQDSIQKARVADNNFITHLDNVTSISSKDLAKIEKLTDFKGLKNTITDIGKVQDKLSKAWDKLDSMEYNTGKTPSKNIFKRGTKELSFIGEKSKQTLEMKNYIKQLDKIQELRDSLGIKITDFNKILDKAYKQRGAKIRITPQDIREIKARIKYLAKSERGTGYRSPSETSISASRVPEFQGYEFKIGKTPRFTEDPLKMSAKEFHSLKQLGLDDLLGNLEKQGKLDSKTSKLLDEHGNTITKTEQQMRTFEKETGGREWWRLPKELKPTEETKGGVATKVKEAVKTGEETRVKPSEITRVAKYKESTETQLAKTRVPKVTSGAKVGEQAIVISAIGKTMPKIIDNLHEDVYGLERIKTNISKIDINSLNKHDQELINQLNNYINEEIKKSNQLDNYVNNLAKNEIQNQTKTQLATQTAIDEMIKDETMNETKDYKGRIFFPIITANGKIIKLTKKQLESSYGWKQGFMYKLWYPVGGKFSKDTLVSTLKKPPFVQEISGKGSPQKSLRITKGTVIETPTVSMGVSNVRVERVGKNKARLVFTRAKNVSGISSSR